MKKRLFKIIGRLKGLPKEEIDSATSEPEAIKLLSEYRIAFGSEWSLWIE